MRSAHVLGLMMVFGVMPAGCDDGDCDCETEVEAEPTTLLGDWDGVCEFYAYDMEVELSIDEEHLEGEELELGGAASITFFTYGELLELEGSLEGRADAVGEVEMTLDFGEDGAVVIVGDLEDADTIDGDCTFDDTEADVELERD